MREKLFRWKALLNGQLSYAGRYNAPASDYQNWGIDYATIKMLTFSATDLLNDNTGPGVDILGKSCIL